MVIDVPVTAISNATGFDGYQVIVMPSENRTIEEEEPTKFSSSGPGNVEISVVNSYAKKAAAMRQNRLQLQCSRCDYKCLTPLLMSFHCKSINCKTTYVEKLILAKQYKLTIFFYLFQKSGDSKIPKLFGLLCQIHDQSSFRNAFSHAP